MQFDMANHFFDSLSANCVFRRPFVWSCRYVSVRKTIFPQDEVRAAESAVEFSVPQEGGGLSGHAFVGQHPGVGNG